MAYCSYCAAALDASQPVCARCGRPVATAPAPISAVADARPTSVRLAGVLLLISCLIGLLSLASIFLTARMPALFLMRSVGFWVLWIVLTILVWQRQGWARIVILLFIAWSVGNLLISMLRIGASGILFTLVFALLVDALRGYAAYLLFKPESNAWFKQ
jgi:hypothetical protein